MNMVKRNSEIKPFYSNFLDDFLNTGLSAFEDRRGVPALNVKEDEKELALELRVPGMKKEDIHLDYKDGILTISGEKNEEKEFIVDSRSVFMRRMCDGGDSGRKSGKSRKRNRVRNGGRFRAISEKR